MLALGVRRFSAQGIEVEFAPEAVVKALATPLPEAPKEALQVQRQKAEAERQRVVAKLNRELRSV